MSDAVGFDEWARESYECPGRMSRDTKLNRQDGGWEFGVPEEVQDQPRGM